MITVKADHDVSNINMETHDDVNKNEIMITTWTELNVFTDRIKILHQTLRDVNNGRI